MKKTVTRISIFGLISLTACGGSNGSANDTTTSESAMETPAPTITVDTMPSQEEIKKEAMLEEDKEGKLLDANNKIKEIANQFVTEVSPQTGHNVLYEIDSSQSTYSKVTKTLDVVYTITWDAHADYGADTHDETHSLQGRIILYDDRPARTEIISMNDVLKRAIGASNAAQKLNDLLDKLSSSSDSK